MPVRQLKISFHRVIVTNPQTPVAFNDILTTLNEVPNDARRTVLQADEPVRLRFLQRIENTWLGDLTRIRLHEHIDKSTVAGRETSIDFEDDEGPCEKTAFVYDSETNVIAIQQIAGGVTASSCGRYFKTIGQVQKIELPIVVKTEALERIQRMGVVAKFQLKLAGIDNGKAARSRNRSAAAMFEFLRTFDAPTASITVAIDKETHTLDRVANFVTEALQWNQDGRAEVKKLLVVGSEDEADERTAIDLFEDRIVEIIPVELEPGQRIRDNERYNAVRTAWNRQRAALRVQFARGRR
jgi:Family of unknown function (DUF6731)